MPPRYAPAAVVLAIGLTACGSSGSSVASGSDTTTASGGAATTTGDGSTTANDEFNDADVAFAQGMIVHHRDALAMADLAVDPATGASADVVDLAQRIQAAQDPEISMMSGWLDQWGQPMDMADDHDMGSMHHDTGQMTAEDMEQLMALKGTAFDQAWLEEMIRHHQGAIVMAEQIQDDSGNPDVLTLADQVITTQQDEIDEMQALLAN